MQIHELKLARRKKRKAVGRGGKRGTYSGRGNKGQKARSGASIDPLFEGGRSSLVERLKKVRGFKSRNAKKTILKIDKLDNYFKDNETISIESLIKAGVIDKKSSKNGVKILGGGKLGKKISVSKDVLLSQSAKDAIIKAGGKIE